MLDFKKVFLFLLLLFSFGCNRDDDILPDCPETLEYFNLLELHETRASEPGRVQITKFDYNWGILDHFTTRVVIEGESDGWDNTSVIYFNYWRNRFLETKVFRHLNRGGPLKLTDTFYFKYRDESVRPDSLLYRKYIYSNDHDYVDDHTDIWYLNFNQDGFLTEAINGGETKTLEYNACNGLLQKHYIEKDHELIMDLEPNELENPLYALNTITPIDTMIIYPHLESKYMVDRMELHEPNSNTSTVANMLYELDSEDRVVKMTTFLKKFDDKSGDLIFSDEIITEFFYIAWPS